MKQMTLTPNLKKLATLLANGNYHSGTDLGHTLGLTRSGIWKLIKQLEGLGIAIESVTNKGYRLAKPLELLDKSKIRKQISKEALASISTLLVFDDLPSTNDYLLTEARHIKDRNIVCLAERQTAGRGRLGRQWISPFGENIYLSLLWNFPFDISGLAGLNITAAVTVAQVIEETLAHKNVQLKWPNDIYWQGRKLGGILIDIAGEHSVNSTAVIGIGLNINMSQDHAEKIRNQWANLASTSSKPLSRNNIAGRLIDTLTRNLLIFQNEGVHPFIKKWNQLDYLRGKTTIVKTTVNKIEGIANGINDNGQLLLKTKDGSLVPVATGDASICMPV